MRHPWRWLWLSALLLAGCTHAPASADATAAATASPTEFDWPHWRGPQDTGISRETAWNSENWPAEGPPVLWSKSIGIGFSSISIADGRAFTMGYEDGNDTVWCFDAASGKELWKHSYPAPLVDNLHEGGPAATPTVDGEHVYTVGKAGHFVCLDALSGEVRWTCEFQKQFDVKMPEWGFSCSPLIVGDLVVVDAGCIAALDKRTGEVRWKTAIYRPGYGSAVAFRHGDDRYIAVLNNDCLLVVSASDGAEIDQFPWTTSYATTSSTPIVDGDTLFISTGYNQGCALLKLTGGKLELVYKNKKMRNHMNNCVLFEGCLYGFDGNSHNPRLVNLVCMDYATGLTKWTHNGLGCGSLMLAGGKLLVLGDEGELVVAPASPEGFQPGPHAQLLEGKYWTVPVLSHGRIYCRNAAGDLVCLDVRRSAG